MANVGFATLQVIPSLRGLDRRMTGGLAGPFSRAGADAGDNFSKGVGSKVGAAGKVISTAAIAGLAGVGVAVGALGGFGIKAAASFQQTRIAFEGILGSAGEADAFLQKMRAFAAKTPFEFPELADSAKNLLAVGFAAKDVIPTMTTLGNVAATLGVGGPEIQGVVRALGQMKGKGKASAEELQQISEQLPGFSAIKAIADDMGISVPAAFEQMRKGAIPADQAIQSILNGMKEFPGAAGAMQRQSLTLNGVFSTFKDTMRDTLVDAFEPLLPTLSKSLTGVTPLLQKSLNNAVGAIAPVLPALLDALAPLLEVATEVIGEVVKGLAPALPELGRAFAELAKAAVPLIPPLANLAVILVREIGVPTIVALAKAMGLFAAAMTPLLEQTQILVPAITALAAGFVGLKVVRSLKAGILGLAKSAGTAYGTVQRVGGAVLDFGRSTITATANIARQTAAFVAQKVAMVAAAVAQKALTAAQWLLNAAMTANPVGLIVTAIAALAAGIFIAYKKFKPFRDIVNAVGRALLTAFNWVKKNWPLILGILTGPFGIAIIIIKKFGPQILSGLKAAFGAVFDFFKQIPARIVSALGAVGSILLNVGKLILAGLLNGAKFALGVYLAFYVKLPVKILGLLKSAGTWLLGVGKKILGGLAKGVITGAVAVFQFFGGLELRILRFYASAATWLVSTGLKILGGLLTGIKNGALKVFEFFTLLPLVVVGKIGDVAGLLFDKGRDILNSLLGGAKHVAETLWNFIAGIPNTILHFLGDVGHLLFDAGRKVVTGFIDGIKSAAGGLKDAVGGLAGGVVDFFPFSPAKTGPLRRHPPEQWGRNIGGLLATGLGKSMPGLDKQLGTIAGKFGALSAPTLAVGATSPRLTLDRATLTPSPIPKNLDGMAFRSGPTLQFNAPIYGFADFKRQVMKMLEDETTNNAFKRGVRVSG